MRVCLRGQRGASLRMRGDRRDHTHTQIIRDQSLKIEADGYVTRNSGRTLLSFVHPEREPEMFEAYLAFGCMTENIHTYNLRK